MISLPNATRFALWLAHAHPSAFRALAAQLQTPMGAPAGGGSPAVRGLGRLGYAGRESYVPAGRARGPRYRPTGAFGDEVNLESLVVDPASLSLPTFDFSSPSYDFTTPDLSSLSVEDITPTSELMSAFDPVTVASAGDSSGFWSSLGSGLSSFASGTAHVIASVAQNLTNPQTLANAGSLAATVIKANAATSVANAQEQAVLATQIARVQAGVTPAAIQYGTNAAGQRVPLVYNTATRQYQATTPQVLSSLMPSSLPSWLPWVLGGGLVLTLVLSSSRS